MYAIVDIAGQQHVVRENQVIKVAKLENSENDSFELDKVLAVGEKDGITFGAPYVEGAKIKVSVVDHAKDKKVKIFKKKRRKRYTLKKGHRQHVTYVKVEEIIK